MPTMYRILRNNKERGPFSLEELLELQLKPFDLIWVEGKSAGWRYPSEIDSLKPHLDPSIEIQEAQVSLNPQKITPIHPASQNTRSTAGASPVGIPATLPLNEDDSTEEELTNEKLERKAAEIYQKVQAYSQQQAQKQQETQTKYARSLEDLKQDYADWLHKKKHKKNFSFVTLSKTSVIAGTICTILIAGTLVFLKNDKKPEDTGLKPGQKYISNKSFESSESPKSNSENIVIPPQPGKTDNPVINKNEPSQTLSVDAFIDSVRRAMAKGQRTKPSRKNANTNTDAVAETVVNTIPSLPDPEPAPPKKEVPTAQQVNMNASYQQDAHRKNISSLEVTIQNNSAGILKTVSVDIFYYKKGDRLFDKETLYFNNIQPGSSMTLSRPGNRKATTARFQLGQVQPGN